MNLNDLDFSYPESLVATERQKPTRVLAVLNCASHPEPAELSGIPELLELFSPGDCLVINETRVLKRRIFAHSGLEILFLNPRNPTETEWNVLCPSSRWKAETEQELPGGIRLRLRERGRIQVVESSAPLSANYFAANGDLPLPPYIQKARGERRNRETDELTYQASWAKNAGSLAAPTASLHFGDADLALLVSRGVRVARLTLHVGLGTFLPITVETLDEHRMHSEEVEIPREAWQTVQAAKRENKKVWALGTTVIRSLEAAARGLIPEDRNGFRGATDLFIRPGFEFQTVDRVLTNFHQPRSTLLALVAAFAGLENVKSAYAWAIERRFRLFSYGDLTVWSR